MIFQKAKEAERQPFWMTGALQHTLEPGAIAPLMWIQVSTYGFSLKLHSEKQQLWKTQYSYPLPSSFCFPDIAKRRDNSLRSLLNLVCLRLPVSQSNVGGGSEYRPEGK